MNLDIRLNHSGWLIKAILNFVYTCKGHNCLFWNLFVFQVDFIDSICLPVYDAFASLNPALSPLRDNCISNKQEWTELAQKEEDLWEKKEWVKNTMTWNTMQGWVV